MTFPKAPTALARGMGGWAARLCALGVLAFVSGCGMFSTKSREEALKEIEWQYAQDAIHLEISADPALNVAGGQAHTLLLVVVQMPDPSAFTPYARDRDKLVQLLLAEAPPDGMVDLQRFFIEPGSTQKLEIPRITDTKYVGVVAGFNHLAPLRSARLYQVGVGFTRKGLVFREYTAAPEPLRIGLRLGSDGIQDSVSARAYPPKPQAPQAGMVRPDSRAPAEVIGR